MTPVRWQQIKAILMSLMELPEQNREAALIRLNGDDRALQEEVRALLAVDDEKGSAGKPLIVYLFDPFAWR